MTTKNERIRILYFDDKKYELRMCGHAICGYRYDEPWQDFTGNKLMYLMFVRLWNAEHSEDQI